MTAWLDGHRARRPPAPREYASDQDEPVEDAAIHGRRRAPDSARGDEATKTVESDFPSSCFVVPQT